MRTISTPALNAGFFNNTSFMEAVREYVENDQTFTFMNSIKGTTAYCDKIKSAVLATVKQFSGVPTFFLILSSAELKWNELIVIIQSKADKVDVNMSHLSYHERCSRHFEYKVEVFFKLIVVDGPLAKSKYAIRVEFQVRSSPHIHSFIWIIGALKLLWKILTSILSELMQ